MKLGRFVVDSEETWGVVYGDTVEIVEGDVFCEFTPSGKRMRQSDVRIFPPCAPSKIVALALNYKSHAEEFDMALPDEPVIFIKPSTAVIGHGEAIVYPPMSQRVDFEAELGVVIGKRATSVSEEEAKDVILGYTCVNDVTARDLQKKDGQFTRSKGFDTFAPMGPWIETEIDPTRLSVESFLNGEQMQAGNTSDLAFPVFSLVAFISRVMTLLPGDVIATGTPSGVGPMEVGDTVEVRVEGIGTLRNTVEAAEP
jgi:2-keto-4-pentenoate hydratase/2-oxohepta-3-ene-1,7-dioic acid hydratase in catechol pathway